MVYAYDPELSLIIVVWCTQYEFLSPGQTVEKILSVKSRLRESIRLTSSKLSANSWFLYHANQNIILHFLFSHYSQSYRFATTVFA